MAQNAHDSTTSNELTGDLVAATLETEIADKSLEMPLLPAVAAEVLATAQEEEADVTRLADLIQQDQALASHLLRIVNSPFGRVLQAIRENDFRAEAIGYRVVRYRVGVTRLSAVFAALAGSTRCSPRR